MTTFLPNENYALRRFYNVAYNPKLNNTYILINWKEAINSDISIGGLRIKKITDYDENANVVNLKKYYYTQEGSSNSSASIGTIPYYGEFTYLQGCHLNADLLLSGESMYP